MTYISTLNSDESRLVLDVTWTPNVLHTTCKQLNNLTNLCFLQPFHCRKTVSLVPFQYFLIYAQNISKMTTPTNLLPGFFPLSLSSENSMECISFCEKHLLMGHINKSEKGKCLRYMTLVTHFPRKSKRHKSCGCNGGHQDTLSVFTMVLSLLNYNIKRL